MARRSRRGPGRVAFALLAAVVLVVAGYLAVKVAFRAVTGRTLGTECTFGDYSTSTDQAVVASTMASVVVRRGLPERAAVLVLAAAMQESKLRNIPPGQGDRDSVGVLQQRPSQGWGSQEQLTDIGYATGAFLDALVKVPHWQDDSLAEVIQRVQISADGSAYAKHGAQAQAMADAFTGTRARAVSCSFERPTEVATAGVVARQLQQALPVNSPNVSGRTITVDGAAWTTVAWFVTNADRLGLDAVAYRGGRWTRSDGWRDADTSSGAVTATLHG